MTKLNAGVSLLAVIGSLAGIAFAGPGNYNQQGPKLMGSSGEGQQGYSIALSADGNTALIGSGADQAWVFVRSGGTWIQQGPFLRTTGDDFFGTAVALSGDGNTAAFGTDDPQGSDLNEGSVYIFTRSGGVWTQQGGKLVGTGAVGGDPRQGWSVALSADGNTLAEGAPFDNANPANPDIADGAVWVFTRSNGVWTQQGAKLVGPHLQGGPFQGYVVALSADGNTLAESGPISDGSGGGLWVFTRSGGVWTEQGAPIEIAGLGVGNALSISGDGNTILMRGYFFTRKNGQWSQNGGQVVGPNNSTPWFISSDGSTAVGPTTDAVEVFVKQGGVWQAHQTASGEDETPPFSPPDNSQQGWSIALSANGNTMIESSVIDDNFQGATWVFASPQLSTLLQHSGNFTQGQMGATYTITVTNGGDRDIHSGTSSAVNVVDHLPAGLVATDIQGSGWTCTLGTVSCTRNDGLAVGASFPAVTVTVNVALDAAASVTNRATASGGGSTWGNARDVTTIVP